MNQISLFQIRYKFTLSLLLVGFAWYFDCQIIVHKSKIYSYKKLLSKCYLPNTIIYESIIKMK